MSSNAIPLVGFAAFSGVGKTTLIGKVIPLLLEQGMRVGAIKQTHHDLELDRPGKDSYELRRAGASPTLLAGPHRWFLAGEYPDGRSPELNDLAARFAPGEVDLLVVEGFRHQPFPKIEVHRPALGHPLLATTDPHVVAIASDAALDVTLPVLPLNRPEAVADFIVTHILHTPT